MYQLNSAKDSRGDEQLFMEEFNVNRAAIEAYKRQRGGDLEGAFQAITGKPWPEGRSVKMKGGAPQMTKDRTVKSVLGKYVAPIAAGALTAFTAGGVAPALAGLFHGGGVAGTAGAAGAAGTAGKAGLGALSRIGGVLGGVGSGISAASSAAGNVRRADLDTNVQGATAYEQQLMNRGQLERQQRQDALKDIYRQSVAANPNVSPYNPVGVRAQSPAYSTALQNVQQQGSERLQTAPQYGTNVVPALRPFKPTKPSTLETIGSWAGPIASTLGAFAERRA